MTMPEVPTRLRLIMQDIVIMRCAICGDIMTGSWPITRQAIRDGADHYLDRHLADLLADRMPRPPLINCTIQDPFWFDEHAPEAS